MVQIEGMEMPKSCDECPCQQYMMGSCFWCGIYGFKLDDDNSFEKRHPNCPLREVKNDKNQ